MTRLNIVRIVPTKYGTLALHYKNSAGRRRRLSVGPDNQYAQRLAIRFTDWLLDGKDPELELIRAQQIEREKKITVLELFNEFM